MKATPATVGVDGCWVKPSSTAVAAVIVIAAEVPLLPVGLSVTASVVVSASNRVTGTVAPPKENVTLLPEPQPPFAGYAGGVPFGLLCGLENVTQCASVYPVNVAPYWSKAVIVTLKGVPATGLVVEGTTVNDARAGAGTVTEPLALLAAVQLRKTAVTTYV